MGALKQPHGGELRNLYLGAEEAAEEKARSKDLKSWDLTPRQMCDIELLLNGGFSPLEGFLGRADYDSVVANMRLADGLLWPIPVTLDVKQDFADTVGEGDTIALRDREGVLIATMVISDKWSPTLTEEFTGISDPYEAPEKPEMRIDTSSISIDQAAQQVLLKVENLGYLK